MTLMNSISRVTTSVDQLTNEANVTKLQLDVEVAQANAEVISAQAEQAATESYREEVAVHAADAATHLATVKAVVNYQGISAILAEKAVTAVDVFVYDTSLDSDGGAWRKRCQHTSWYNENLHTATRGSRREFPAVTIIVVELPNKVTIFDADDPDLPMWMIADTRGEQNTAPFAITALGGQANYLGPVSALNGQIFICGTGGYSSQALLRWDFLADRFGNQAPNSSYSGWTAGTISERNELRPFVEALPVISAPQVHHVAVTVLPEAPIDPATGLPVPTIGLATDGGVSVIKQDGTVINPFTNYGMQRVHFSEDALYYWQTGDHQLRRVAAPDFVVNAIDFYGWRDNAIRPSISPRNTFSGIRHVVSDGKSAIAAAAAANTNLALLQETRIGTGLSMVAYAASDYATGWMPGKIKLAALADTDQSDLASSEQVTNGTFEMDMNGWVAGSGDGESAEVIDGALRVYGNAYIYQAVPTVAGQTYRARFEIIGGTGGVADFRIGYGPNGTQLYDHPANVGVGVYETYFTATGPTTFVTLKTHFQPGALSDFMDFDNISVRPGVPDRSVNNSGFTVHGTVRRGAVANGAELASYGNMVTNVDFLGKDFNGSLSGASTFAMVFWAKGNPSSQVFGWHEAVGGGTSAQFFNLYFDGTTGQPRFIWQGRRSLNVGGDCPPHNGQWALHVAIFEDGDFCHYQDGKFMSQYLSHGIVSDLHELRIHPVGTASLSLFRITETIPTPDQIVKIYEDERKLFMPGAACTLYGTSDAVTALAHDPKTNLLHVGTSQGRSVFDGLQRVGNTETPVTTVISAVNGLIVEQ